MVVSGVFVGVDYAQGKKREREQGARGTARVSTLTGALGRSSRVRAGARGGIRKRGTRV
mgnify:CR=1 FL=1